MGQDREDSRRVTLTERERQVAELVAQNLSCDGIARELGISVSTVRAHLRTIGHKIPGRGRTYSRIMRWWFLSHPPQVD
jgi:DNA-binding CsgD family transcriptional regulator